MFLDKKEIAEINERRKKYMDLIEINGIKYVKITKEEWNKKGHVGQDGKKYIMRYTNQDGTHLRPCIVEGYAWDKAYKDQDGATHFKYS
ncbi:MAG: hypothetical protein CMB77_02245 [Euryarchaeota archaeon]|nr:hypothetical protein [Euryarchaeota archaeon]|tara:strand:- start:5273 stop:5539 length:267 start_codon:yes stop_codon:yes gene_type:complete